MLAALRYSPRTPHTFPVVSFPRFSTSLPHKSRPLSVEDSLPQSSDRWSNTGNPNGRPTPAEVDGVVNDSYSKPKESVADALLKEHNSSTTFMSQAEWQPFQENQWIKPHHFTYKSRISRSRLFPARPLVAPSTREARYNDVFHQLNIDPLKEVLNVELLSAFVTDTGRILNRKDTRLTSKSQRKLGKAIRRAKMMGLMPRLGNRNRLHLKL